MTKQLTLFKKTPHKNFFGGKLLYKKRKSKRPLAYKKAIHLVLRSSFAKGSFSFLKSKNKNFIEKLLIETAHRFNVKLYRRAIAGNHLHLIILCPDQDAYHGFVSVVSGRCASHVMNYQSFKNFLRINSTVSGGAPDSSQRQRAGGAPSNEELFGVGQRFFNFRPFSRILHWGLDFKRCCNYVTRNTLEALGFTPYTPRKDFYHRWIVTLYPD